MLLNRLKLANFRQHVSTEIEFGRGVTAIIGENGAGKTTILEAILVGLFGVKAVGAGEKESFRTFFGTGEKFRIEMDFVCAGQTYHLVREEDDARLQLADEWNPFAVGISDVSAACQRLLRMNSRQFVNSFCARQKRLAFLDFERGRRREEVARMLDYHRVKQAADLAHQWKRALESELKGRRASLPDPKSLESEKGTASVRLDHERKRLKNLQAQLEHLEKELPDRERLAAAAARYDELTSRIAQLESAGEERKAAIEDAEARLTKEREEERMWDAEKQVLNEYDDLKKQFHHLDTLADAYARNAASLGKIEELTRSVDRLQAELSALPESRLPETESLLARAQQRARDAAQSLQIVQARWQDEQRRAAADRATAQATLRSAEDNLAEAERLAKEGICPTCRQPTTTASFETRLRELRAAVADAQSELEAVMASTAIEPPASVVDAEQELKEADAAHTRAQNEDANERVLEGRRETLRAKILEFETHIASISSNLDPAADRYDPDAHQKVKKRIEELTPSVERALALRAAPERARAAAEDLERKRMDFEAHARAIAELKQDRSTLPFRTDEDAVCRIREFERAKTERDQIKARVDEASRAVANAEGELERIERRECELLAQRAEVERLEEQLRLNAIVAESLSGLHAELSRRAKPQLEAKASRHLQQLTHGRYTVLRLDDDFEPEVSDHGTWKRILSGGEEDVVALSLRLAFSEMIQERSGVSVSLLILDEVFGSLDEERRHLLVEQLRVLRDRFEQVIVISHIEDVIQTADRCVRLRRDPRSRATVVEAREIALEKITLA